MGADDLEAVYQAAAQQALVEFPVEPRNLELFAISENITFRLIDTASGATHALRLHRPGYNSLAKLESERDWTAALGQAGVPTRGGAHFCEVVIPGLEESRYAGLTHWLPGQPLSASLEDEADDLHVAKTYRQIGRLAARMHDQSCHWQTPAGFTRPRLDGAGLLGETPRWGRFWENPRLSDDEQALLESMRSPLRERLQAYGETSDNFGLIHADLHPENLVLHEGQLSVIDFDDAAYGWHAYDLATALIEHWGSARYPLLRSEMLGGYREQRRFSPGDEQMLETFLLLRGMAIIGWFAERPEHNESEYFLEIRDLVVDACRDSLVSAVG